LPEISQRRDIGCILDTQNAGSAIRRHGEVIRKARVMAKPPAPVKLGRTLAVGRLAGREIAGPFPHRPKRDAGYGFSCSGLTDVFFFCS
jgi:hypothetical protein